MKRLQCQPDLRRGGRDGIQLTRAQAPVVANGGVANELADPLRILGGDHVDQLDEDARDKLAHIGKGGQHSFLGPVAEATSPEVVVLVEVALLAGLEVLAPAGQSPLERGQRSSRSTLTRSDSARTLSSSSARSVARFSTSTAVTIEAAK